MILMTSSEMLLQRFVRIFHQGRICLELVKLMNMKLTKWSNSVAKMCIIFKTSYPKSSTPCNPFEFVGNWKVVRVSCLSNYAYSNTI